MTLLTRILLTIAIAATHTAPAVANTEPLLLPGKQSLYQRVLAVPGAKVSEKPNADGKPVTPFTAYYVYDRRNTGGTEWLQVGTDRHGGISGWLPADASIAWTQGLTVAFRDAIGRDRALLFDNADAVRALARDRDLETYGNWYAAAEAGESLEDSPVVAIQPPGELDIRKNFYLVPILEHEDLYLGSEQARLLQVSSVPLQSPASDESKTEPAAAESTASADNGYRAGLVFAIDATLSMDPYIDRTREAVMKIYDALGDAGLLGNVNFGLVAFRDSPQAVPELEYLARTYVDLEQGRNPGTFIKQINGLSAASVSSQDFIEDAYAGVKQALDDMDWSTQSARYLVLVTDAGPRLGSDPLSSTGMDAEALRRLAREKGVAIFVLHLLTEATRADHAAAAVRVICAPLWMPRCSARGRSSACRSPQ